MSESFQAGMHIRYGTTGICLIDRIEDVPYPGPRPTRTCYVLKPLRNVSLEISVPLDNEALCAKLQPLRTKEELDRLFAEALQQPLPEWNPERKPRAAEFRQMLSGRDTLTLMLLLRTICAQREQSGTRLTTADDIIRKDAEQLLAEELRCTMHISAAEAHAYIQERLAL